MPFDTTIAPTGSHSVSLKTTRHEKDQFRVIITGRANGVKAKLYVVFTGKCTQLRTVENQKNCVLFSSNG